MNKVAVIVGASSGIGLECAKKLMKDGDTVYNCSRTEASYEGIKNLSLDVVNVEDIGKCLDSVMHNEKRIDIAIYCAGFSMAAPLEYVRSHDYRYLFDVNFFGAVEFIKAVVPKLRPAGGKIIVISSLGGVIPIPYDPYYSASKAALNMLVESLSFELEKQNIYLTSVMPGGTKTEFSFKRKIYKKDEINGYEDDMQKSVCSLQTAEQNGMSAEKVADTVLSVTQTAHPPLLVSCGIKNKVLLMLYKMLPKRLGHKLVCLKYRIS